MKYYAIANGYDSNKIVTDWEECKSLVIGYKGAKFKKFETLELAKKYLSENNLSSLKISPRSDYETKIRTENSETTVFNLYTDGSLIKKDSGLYCGYGIFIPDKNIKISSKLEGKKTNNRAELTAIISAINIFSKEDNVKLHIYTDSAYSIGIFGETGKKYQLKNYMKNSKVKVPNSDLVEVAMKLTTEYILAFTHINSHTSNTDQHSKGNAIADMLAVRGAVKDYIDNGDSIENYKLSFGKYKNVMLKNIPINYLKWLLTSEIIENLCNKNESYRLEKELVLTYLDK